MRILVVESSNVPESHNMIVGDLSLDLLTHKVRRGEVNIELQPREFALLEYLMRNCNRVVSKTMILDHVWNYNFDPKMNVVAPSNNTFCKLNFLLAYELN